MTKLPNCYICQRYPLCRVFTDIQRVLSTNGVHKTTRNVINGLARDCSYYKEEKQ